MNICVVNPNYYRSSGVTIALKRLYEGADGLNARWHFVDCHYGDDAQQSDLDWLRDGESPVVTCSLMAKSPPRLLKAIIQFRSFILARKIDVVHVHHRRLAMIVGALCRVLGVPVVYTGHLAYGKRTVPSLLFVDAAIAISSSVRRDIEQYERCKTIYDISNATPFAEPEHLPSFGGSSVICVARLEPVKNHATLLQAWKRVVAKKPDAELLLIGEGALRDELVELSRRLSVEENVKFLGFTREVPLFIDKSMFMILPSFVEGQPIVVLEAAGRGKATLVSDAPGARDCVPPGARLPNRVDPHSADDIATAVLFWLADPSSVREEGRRFYDYWKDQASPATVASRHLSVYREVAGREKAV
ncbi:glycosyltransferase family 4 protein [Rhizobium sp. CSW-27]|uniref:glycosyltransferase family 4 protein n=1 Tax=Rhizobium sp. CSW-27 TaxID=2839985 RepID=UPI001C027D98|nr:glycosyltransferase family 4 protein [Rhizobium sp. CSW-27]MBT9371836.1 glycosyltransferase family 4 protein [Rhizobium sp. CSW-27]